jgi:hypothetical protein
VGKVCWCDASAADAARADAADPDAANPDAASRDVRWVWIQLRRELQMRTMQHETRVSVRGPVHGSVRRRTQREVVRRRRAACSDAPRTDAPHANAAGPSAQRLPRREPVGVHGALPRDATRGVPRLRRHLRHSLHVRASENWASRAT